MNSHYMDTDSSNSCYYTMAYDHQTSTEYYYYDTMSSTHQCNECGYVGNLYLSVIILNGKMYNFYYCPNCLM